MTIFFTWDKANINCTYKCIWYTLYIALSILLSCDLLLQWEIVKVLELSVRVLLRPQLSERIVANTQDRMYTFKKGVAESVARCGSTYGTNHFQAQSRWSQGSGLLH